MEERQLASILLSYKIENRILNDYYKYFLKMLGIFTWEELKKENNEFDINVDIEVSEIKKEKDFSISPNKLEKLKKTLELQVGKEYLNDWYDELIRIYDKYNLFGASVTLDNFKISCPEVLEAGERFLSASEELAELIENNKNYQYNRHIRYAKLYCKERANFAKYTYNETVFFYINGLAVEGLALLKQFSQNPHEEWNSIIWQLLGNIYRISKQFSQDSIDSYERAIELIKDKPYVSNVYYDLGSKCKEYLALKDFKNKFIKKSFEICPNAKNTYNIAIIYYENKEWEESLKYLNILINLLGKKEQILSPLELIYYYKSLEIMSNIHLKLKNYHKVLEIVDKALILKKNILNGIEYQNKYTNFYYETYSIEEAKKHINLTLEQMKEENFYRILGESYMEVGMVEESEKYYILYRNCGTIK